MRVLSLAVCTCFLSVAGWAQYESSYGIKSIGRYPHLAIPVNIKYAYDFSGGAKSFAGAWRAVVGDGAGKSAAVRTVDGYAGNPALRFDFALVPGGPRWVLLHLQPGRYSPIELTPEDGFCFRARTHGEEMDGYPARWYLQVRVLDDQDRCVSFRTDDFEVLRAWQTFYVSALDLGREGQAGLFAGGVRNARLCDICFVPHVEKYRRGDLTLGAFAIYGPGRKIPGRDTDGDGLPDPVDGDNDNDGVLDGAQDPQGPLEVERTGFVDGGGQWQGRFRIESRHCRKGDTLEVGVAIRVVSADVAAAIPAVPEIVGLLSGERRYDRRGRYHSFSNHMISGLLTPAGLPVENFQPLIPNRHVRMSGVTLYSSPLDAICRVPLARVRRDGPEIGLEFSFRVPIGRDVPEGHYRLFFEFGAMSRDGEFLRLSSLPSVAARERNAGGVGQHAADENLTFEKKIVLPLIRVGEPAPPRMPWAMLFDTEVHGVKGVVPEEERGDWALNFRNRLASRPVFPKGRHNLEPGFPSLAYESLNVEYPLSPRSGELTVRVTGPDGSTTDLGTAPFAALTTWGATTRTGRFWYDFDRYGEYVVEMKGWILDACGNRLAGGGTYRLWIAERITFGTFPSRPYEVGEPFLSAVEVVPPVPAEVSLAIDLYPGSDVARKETFVTRGTANRLGLFVAPRPYVFPRPGEYLARMEAEFVDPEGRLWLGSLWSANVVAPAAAVMVAHGISGYMENSDFRSTEPRFALGTAGDARAHRSHFVYYPYHAGDVLFMPSTMDHMNAIFPLLTMAFRDRFVPYGGEPGDLDCYPVRPTTGTGNSPFCFPEEIDRLAYYYADGWRPGVSGRHVVGTAQMMNSYWSVSPSLLGRQMHTSLNGDLPGDVYRFTGGVVYRDLRSGKSRYAIYVSTGAITAASDMNNRVVAPCVEPLLRLNNRDHYLFLGGAVLPVPGMIFEPGLRVPIGGAVNPGVPAELKTTVSTPTGHEHDFHMTANRIGRFPRGSCQVLLDEPGVWQVRHQLAYAGKRGDVLGSEDGTYAFYVLPRESDRRFELAVGLPPVSRVGPGEVVCLSGTVPADVVDGCLYYTTISPGAILVEGSYPIVNGMFHYEFDPWETGRRVPFYDTSDYLTGEPMLCDTVVFNLFLEGRRVDGTRVYGHRVIAMRGDTVLNVTPADPPAIRSHQARRPVHD